jgi:hypothetical protein
MRQSLIVFNFWWRHRVGTITAGKAYQVMMNSSITGYQPSISLLCDIMMYKNKDISSRP